MAEAGSAPLCAGPVGPAQEADVAALARLAQQAALPGWNALALATAVRDASQIVRVVRAADAAPLGFALARCVSDEVEILLVAVAAGARRRGLGRALVRAVLAAAARDGARVAHLEVRASNRAALGLYAALGFVACGRRPRYYAGQEDAVRMRLAIEGRTG